MEAKLSGVLFGCVAIAWGAITLTAPAVALEPGAAVDELARLEDAFAADRSDPVLARVLADHYLALQKPRLAVATLSAAAPAVRDDPAVLHRLARAYEETGRMDDALATARLAVARCARAIGTADSSEATPTPAHGCTEGTYAALDMHRAALAHMTRWGVTDVETDGRARRAYLMAVRSARIVSAHAE